MSSNDFHECSITNIFQKGNDFPSPSTDNSKSVHLRFSDSSLHVWSLYVELEWKQLLLFIRAARINRTFPWQTMELFMEKFMFWEISQTHDFVALTASRRLQTFLSFVSTIFSSLPCFLFCHSALNTVNRVLKAIKILRGSLHEVPCYYFYRLHETHQNVQETDTWEISHGDLEVRRRGLVNNVIKTDSFQNHFLHEIENKSSS